MRRALLAALLLVAVVGAGCSGDDDAGSPAASTADRSSPAAYEGDVAGFYAPPDPLPKGRHGDLIRHQRLDDPAGGGALYRVMYRSTSVAGAPIAVTGMVALPSGGGSGRPVLTWAHGTAGIADGCAPSKAPDGAVLQLAGPLLGRGWVLAATDYEGLGTPGRHPYLAGISEGRGTLDIVLAAGQLPRARTGPETLIWGHSQGGHAALFAAELADDWTPELDVVGAVAGAPPSQLTALDDVLRGGSFQGYIALAAAGLNAAYPEARLDEVLSPKGIDLLDAVDEGCVSDVFATFGAEPFDDLVVADPADVPSWRKVLEANEPGTVAHEIPLLLIHGEADEQIPPVSSALLLQRLCGLGQAVERRTYPGAGHADVIGPSLPDMLTWMDARLAGEPAASGCPKT